MSDLATACAQLISFVAVPETTSAETLLERYSGGKPLVAGSGEPWRAITVSTYAMPSTGEAWNIPSVSEPVLILVTSGEVEVEEKRKQRPLGDDPREEGIFLSGHGRLAL